uniref:BZIP domain-containing protein n=2 Tax=Acrobeloides nanus TaxID=290746 RepID=A0A914E6K8_9BILA
MTSSLTQPSTLTFNSTRFLPLDLTQSVYGLYPQTQPPAPPCSGFTPFPSALFYKELQEAHEASLKLNSLPLCVNLPSEMEPLNLINHSQSVITKTTNGVIENGNGFPIKTSAVRVIRSDQSASVVTSSTSDTDSTTGSNSVSETPDRSSTQSKVIVTNPDKRRKEIVRDDAYWERRRKNNDAAKRSRDSRRKKEDEIAVRAAILEQENLRLRFEVERLRTEIDRHRMVALKTSPFNAATNLAAAIAAANASATLARDSLIRPT